MFPVSPGKMTKALIIDDVADNVDLMTFDLQDEGYEVISANEADAGIKLAEQEVPDIILLDVNMPGISGIEACRKIRGDEKIRDIPIILVTANHMDDDIEVGLDAGANDYVTKPYHYEVLAARIRTALRLKEAQDRLVELNNRLEEVATTDSLTGLYNRRHFLELVSVELARAWRHNLPLAICIMDVDKFKQINDINGHLIGDQVLIEIAQVCQSQCREVDIMGRFGGDEFVLCCPDSDAQGALMLTERCREMVNKLEIEGLSQETKASVSWGIASLEDSDKDIASILARADQALYKSKSMGRNKVSGV